MEIEAKFAVPDKKTLARLGAAGELAGCALGAPTLVEMCDTYLDTASRAILGAGYVLRHRQREHDVVMTLKSTGGARGGVHRREELEITLPRDVAPADWPADPLRDKVLALCTGAPLEPLVELTQRRRFRAVTRDGREIAELALDEVTVATAVGELPPYRELEVELRADGTEADLELLVSALRDDLALKPEPLSKFERAMAAAGLVPASDAGLPDDTQRADDGALLDDSQRGVLRRVARRKGVYAHRAKALLALDAGETQVNAGASSGLAERTVRYWLMQFRARGLAIFPSRLLAQVPEAHQATAPTASGMLAAPAGSPQAAPAPAAPAPEQPAPPMRAPRRPGVKRTDTMAEAAAKTLRFHFARMLAHESGTRAGTDPEELHDMRVATRRMRAALHIFADHLDPVVTRPLVRGLRRTGRTLGAVRDLDVFHDKMQVYRDALPDERRDELDPLLTALTARRKAARERLLAYLDGPRYARFVDDMRQFVDTPGAGALPAITAGGEARPSSVADVLPAALYTRLAAVWAYDAPLAAADAPLVLYHRLRIAGKFLRYTLEFFEEALGSGAKPMIETTKQLQDHLGDLQDAVVACTVLRNFLTFGAWEPPAGRKARALPPGIVMAPGVATYLAARQSELTRLVTSFPQTWRTVRGAEFAAQAAAVVARLTAARPARRAPSA
jgi:CHAD domain-containing protein